MTSGESNHRPAHALRLASIAVAIILIAAAAFAAPTGKAYSTPEKAVEALIKAVRANDLKTMLSILGKDADSLVESGDPVRDKEERESAVALFDKKHSLKTDGSTSILISGDNDWPFPIPIVKTSKGWQFDSAAGKEELLNRRIGKNELSTIQDLLSAVEAQRVYYETDHDDDGLLEFAQKFRSTLGRHDGLFWPTKEGEQPSPLGLLVAQASAEGYSPDSPAFHGYHFRMLTSQGPRARGGEYDYMVRGNLLGGFAIIAWPANWGDSGVVTFLVNHDGKIFQKDLGEQTEAIATKIMAFDPDESWTPVADSDLKPVQ
jgi:hypothetical protein